MDIAPDTILRSPVELADHLYCVGYWRSTLSRSGRRHDFQTVWQEMVGWCPLFFCVYRSPWYRTLRRGKHRLLLWPGKEADGSMDTTTPSKLGTRDEMGRLEKVRLLPQSTRLLTCATIAILAREKV